MEPEAADGPESTGAAAEPRARDRVADRDQALRELMREHGDAVHRYCREVLRDDALADDVHQQVFVEAHDDLGSFEGRSSVKTWLFGIARHRCLDAIKSRRRWVDRFKGEPADDLPDPVPGIDDRIDEQRLTDALARCLDGLAPHVRAAVMLRYQQGLSYEDMARGAGERPDTMRQRVVRALPALKKCIEDRTRGRL